MEVLANTLWRRADEDSKQRAEQLWRQAALLGSGWSQAVFAYHCLPPESVERMQWMRRAVAQGSGTSAVRELIKNLRQHLGAVEQGGSGRLVFEIGAAMASFSEWRSGNFGSVEDCSAALRFYEEWCAAAQQAIMCWVWTARQLGMARDVRLLIADLAWDERAAWSERVNQMCK